MVLLLSFRLCKASNRKLSFGQEEGGVYSTTGWEKNGSLACIADANFLKRNSIFSWEQIFSNET